MQQLIFKDVMTQKWYIYLTSVAWFILFTNFFTDGSPIRHVMLLSFLPAWLAFCSNGNTKSFEKESALLISLPVKRSEVVRAKYAASFLWFGLSTIAIIVYIFLYDKLAPFPTRMMHVDELFLAFSIFLFLVAIFYPVLFRAGYQVATIVLVVITGFGLMAMQISFNMLRNPRLVEFHQFVEGLSANQLNVTIAFVFISVICFILSYLLSVRIFNKRDL
mgnify:FL=1